MSLRKSLFCAMTLTAGVFAQGGPPDFRLLGARPGRPAPLVKGAPFTADIVTETTQSLPDGNKIRQSATERVYRDGEGRTRREPSLAVLGAASSSNAPQLAFIDDPVAGASYALDLTNRTVTRSVFYGRGPGGGPRANAAPPGGNSGQMYRGRGGQAGDRLYRPQGRREDSANFKTESLGRQTVNGVPADGTRVTQTIPAGQIGNALPIQILTERWYSPDLQMVVLQKRSDPRNGETVMQMSNLIRAEPPANLFSPPADFQTQTATPRARGGRKAQ